MRLHLFEFEDLPWLPTSLRNGGLEVFRLTQELSGLPQAAAPELAGLLARTGAEQLVDLCSGSSGPVPRVLEDLAKRGFSPSVVLTDRFPNLRAFERERQRSGGRIEFVREPVDARDVPPEIEGVRTLFNALHHFRPTDARRIIANAVEAKQPIASFELARRDFVTIAGVIGGALVAPLMVLLARPFRWSRVLWTFPIPILPATILWDGIVSCLRGYSPAQLRELVDGLDDDYTWRIGVVRMVGPSKLTYLVGMPGTAA
jgi:hypothetical protein